MMPINIRAVKPDLHADMLSTESVLREPTSVQKHNNLHTMNSPITLRLKWNFGFTSIFRAAHHEIANQSPRRFQIDNAKK